MRCSNTTSCHASLTVVQIRMCWLMLCRCSKLASSTSMAGKQMLFLFCSALTIAKCFVRPREHQQCVCFLSHIVDVCICRLPALGPKIAQSKSTISNIVRDLFLLDNPQQQPAQPSAPTPTPAGKFSRLCCVTLVL